MMPSVHILRCTIIQHYHYFVGFQEHAKVMKDNMRSDKSNKLELSWAKLSQSWVLAGSKPKKCQSSKVDAVKYVSLV